APSPPGACGREHPVRFASGGAGAGGARPTGLEAGDLVHHGGVPDPRILASYTDALGAERSSPQWAVDHVDALLSEARTGDDDGGYVDVIRARAGEPAPPGLRGRTLSLEDGGELRIDDRVPSDLPFGYHRIEDGPVLVLHAPTQVPSAG